ncbi:MAG TPA: hypothetical protein VKD43_14160 [Xanthobacteraceae bacterium]|nr:hypothetical protein [Xanthobacteraceae bacterium]
MKGSARFAVLLVLLGCAIATVVRGGHELPVYPSFYPHEIEIKTLPSDRAGDALRQAKVQAYVGPGASLSDPPPAEVRAIESLGSFVIVRLNPASAHAFDEASACAAARTVAGTLAGHFVLHPYPVTPFHGDYLHHADLAAAAKARFLEGGPPVRGLRIKGSNLVQDHPQESARDADWDAEIIEVDAAGLVASAMLSVNGWLAPPWVRTGWFHAERLTADSVVDAEQRRRVESDLLRLETGDFNALAERINLERDLVTALIGSCRKVVIGYTVKREYVNVEYSAGIENIGYDAIAGLHSPIFIRTVKLKDFPWNGWLALGTASEPGAAWNPIGGMNDPFGRLMGFAVGDPALLPSPYESGWMLNRIADLPADPAR